MTLSMIYYSFVYDTSQDGIMYILEENRRKDIVNNFFVFKIHLN
jgi:hypothetical protein